jgi:outer membrane protein assembly factor BamB
MARMPSPDTRRRQLRRGLVAVAVLLLALGGTVAFVLLHSPGNVSHPNLQFTAPSTTPPRHHKAVPVNNFEWPRYGFDAGRTHDVPAGAALDPPFRSGWKFDDHALLEFPPVIYQNTLYFVDDNGWAKAIDRRTGLLKWLRHVGTLAAASPAIGVREQMIFAPLLSTNPRAGQNQDPGNGRLVGLRQRDGKVVWSRPVPAGTETSPLVYGRTLYYGDLSGNVYALRARDGQQLWSYHASGAVKGGPSVWNGVLYFGDYAGKAYALDATTGRKVWAVTTEGAHFGFGSGQFYSSPAVAFGRVYMGNTDGRVYSFAAGSGQLAWATATSAYVYASPAVANVAGLGPTVYAGSYDGNFYAFDARSGRIRWTHSSGGKISGSATIIGDVVYYSDLGTKRDIGLDVRTGREVFSLADGAFNAAIADRDVVYMIGYGTIYQLLPARPTHSRPRVVATKQGRPARAKGTPKRHPKRK